MPPWPASWQLATLDLDEPFSALDSYLREEVGEVGSLLAGFAGTALLVTTTPGRGLPPVQEMIVMDSGEVLQVGTTKEVFADPRTRAAARPDRLQRIFCPAPGWGSIPFIWRAGSSR